MKRRNLVPFFRSKKKKSLKRLSMSTARISKELPCLLGKLPSLTKLELQGSESGLEKAVLSWVGNLKQLTALELVSYDFSESAPSWIGNLTNLKFLWIWDCNFSGSIIPYQIGNLAKLETLDFRGCEFFGQQIPPWIGNFTKLANLEMDSCGFSGSIPSTIGNLTQLEYLTISYNNQLNGKTIYHDCFSYLMHICNFS